MGKWIRTKHVGMDTEDVRIPWSPGACPGEFEDVSLTLRLDSDLQLIRGGVGSYMV